MPSGQPTSSSCNSSSKATTTSALDLGPGAALIQGNMNVAAAAVPAQNSSVIDLVEAITPHQPADFIFPGRQFGKETFSRSFNTNWFDKWRWLHYIEEGDRIVCFSCVKAVEKRLINEDSVRFDSSFVKGGFTNWRKATEKFNEHEKSKLHCDAIQKIAAAVQSTPITAILSAAALQAQATARHVLELMFRSVLFLGKKGVAFRGDSTRDGIFYELMLEHTYNLPRERQWIERRNNCLSDTIQNEIIQQYACAIQREIVSLATNSPFYGLTADGTTDSSTMEQFSLTLQYVDEKLESHSDFLGFYSAPDSSGETLFRCIKDVFLRLNIPIERLLGYCFDGASNMSGRFSGVQAWLKKTCPESLFVHCANHSLDLVLQEAAREVGLIADSVNFVQGVAVVIRESAKRKDLYQSMFGCDDVVTLLAIRPTKWCIRTTAIKRVCSGYREIIKTLEQLKEDRSVRGDIRAKIRGLHKQAMKAKTYYGLLCCEAIFEPCESVARSLQHTKASALGTLKCAELLERCMEALRDDAVVDNMLQTVSSSGLKMTDENRMTKTPTRYRHTTEPEAEAQVAQHSLWRREFYEAVDLVRAEVKRRFDQDGMKTAAFRENVLINAANKKQIVDIDSLHLPQQIDKHRLEIQLKMMGDLCSDSIETVKDITTTIFKLHPQTRTLFKEVENLIKLCLSLPISAASAERTFSALRRLKTWLRTTMTQKLLPHLALMHVHGDILDSLDIDALMRDFISINPERKATFGVLHAGRQ